ncbi:MAG: hypothetical protein LJF04_09315 [Gemmatimonadetes bacterium]|nr:hypothetical protein [Gemmatimonadota bacterium]
MFRHISMLPVLAAGLVAAACTDDGITDPTLMNASQPLAQVVAADHTQGMVPFTWTYHMTPISAEVVVCTNSDGSPPFLPVPKNYTGTGNISHMGRMDPDATLAWFTDCVVNMVGEIPVTASGGIVAHLVGANGDAVDMEGVLTVSFADFSATGEWEITGGTGRFTDASGWINTYEVAAEDGSGSVGSGSGMITRPGSFGH